MAGCTFDSMNYVGTACSGFVAVANGSYIICSGAPGGCVQCTDPTIGLNNVSIFKARCDAENAWNAAENCHGSGSCVGNDGSGCWLPSGQQGCCQGGQCVASGGGGVGGTCSPACATGSFCIFGTCVPQVAALGIVALGILFLRGRR